MAPFWRNSETQRRRPAGLLYRLRWLSLLALLPMVSWLTVSMLSSAPIPGKAPLTTPSQATSPPPPAPASPGPPPAVTAAPPSPEPPPVAAAAAPAAVPAAPPAAQSPAPPPPAPARILGGLPAVSVCGINLCLGSVPWRFAGVDAYELGTLWSVNWGCGTQVSDAAMDQLFSGLRANSLVRTWAFQAQAFDAKTTHRIDFRPLDRVVAAAERHHQRLVLTITNQDGTCDDGHWKDAAWYRGGFNQAYDDHSRGLTPLPFSQYMRMLVTRYRSSPALGLWEPVNEPEASSCAAGWAGWDCPGHLSCPPGGAAALRSFFDAAGAQIKSLDPSHPISSGALGGTQCGWAGDDYSFVHASPGIDVASYHDYGSDGVPLPAEVASRIRQAAQLGKPVIAGESGIKASGLAVPASPGCVSEAQRSLMLTSKILAQYQAGASTFLVWNWVPQAPGGCAYDSGPGDPLLTLLSAAPLGGQVITAGPVTLPIALP